jgi:hypothetical protein
MYILYTSVYICIYIYTYTYLIIFIDSFVFRKPCLWQSSEGSVQTCCRHSHHLRPSLHAVSVPWPSTAEVHSSVLITSSWGENAFWQVSGSLEGKNMKNPNANKMAAHSRTRQFIQTANICKCFHNRTYMKKI